MNRQVVVALTEEGNTLKRLHYENGKPVLYAENSSYTYVLTEQQAQELGKTVMALYSVEGDLILVLEVTE